MELFLAILNIILIDIVLSGDNALIIGMAVKNLPDLLRKKAIFRGTIAATVMRIIFSLLAVYLLQIVGLKLLGGCLLMYVVWKFYKNIRL
jgi:predicted tellurium resistance membrane protein TerC